MIWRLLLRPSIASSRTIGSFGIYCALVPSLASVQIFGPEAFNARRRPVSAFPTYRKSALSAFPPAPVTTALAGKGGSIRAGSSPKLNYGLDMAVGGGSSPTVNAARQRLCTDPDSWTSDAIGGLLPVDPNLRIGAEQKEQKVYESFKGSVLAKLLRSPTRC